MLIVDDDEDQLALLRRVLRCVEGVHEVDVASNAEEARALAARNEYALVIADLRMPGENGLTLLGAFAALSPRTRRALHTGVASDFREELQREKLHGLIEKPASVHELRELTRRLVAQFDLVSIHPAEPSAPYR